MEAEIIVNTTYPDSPIDSFNEWQQYIHTIRQEEGEHRRYKREIEISFDTIHKSITQGIPKQ